jgi:hypothetical protein
MAKNDNGCNLSVKAYHFLQCKIELESDEVPSVVEA